MNEQVAGWVMILLVVGTVGGIMIGSTIGPVKKKMFSLAGCLFVALAAIWFGAMKGEWRIWLELNGIFAGWIGCWTGLARVRQGGERGWRGIGALLAATVLMSAPITWMPLVHALGTGRESIVQVIRCGCPFFAITDALRPAIVLDWPHLPGMYVWSGLGQDVPMLLPNGWLCAGIYSGVAVIFWMAGYFFKPADRVGRESP